MSKTPGCSAPSCSPAEGRSALDQRPRVRYSPLRPPRSFCPRTVFWELLLGVEEAISLAPSTQSPQLSRSPTQKTDSNTSPPGGPKVLWSPAWPHQPASLTPRTPSTAIPKLSDWLAGAPATGSQTPPLCLLPRNLAILAQQTRPGAGAETRRHRDPTPHTSRPDSSPAPETLAPPPRGQQVSTESPERPRHFHPDPPTPQANCRSLVQATEVRTVRLV